jgi:hypothetical protein
MELGNLHDLGMGLDPPGSNPGSAAKKAANSQRAATPLAGFLCPTRRAVGLYPFTSTAINYNVSAAPNNLTAKTDYAANGGDKSASPDVMGIWPSNCGNTACGPPLGPVLSSDALTQLNFQVMNFGPTGIVCAMKMTSAAEITDGLANTYLVAEKYLETDLYKTGVDPADNECAYIGDNQDITRYTYLAPMRDRHGLVNSWGFGSLHVNGFNACMCDISVRSISYAIDPTVHRYLGNKADGLSYQPPN